MTKRTFAQQSLPGRYPGLFLSFEGTDGSGKSTQMRLLVEHLRRDGFTVVENQEPGATHIGLQIRRILLDPAHQEMAGMTELLLMFASRAQATAEIIRPALDRGDIVVSDRFTDSTLAYQGEGRGIGFVFYLHAPSPDIGPFERLGIEFSKTSYEVLPTRSVLLLAEQDLPAELEPVLAGGEEGS